MCPSLHPSLAVMYAENTTVWDEPTAKGDGTLAPTIMQADDSGLLKPCFLEMAYSTFKTTS